MLINTRLGQMDDRGLLRKDVVIDNEEEHVTAVEYCLLDCADKSHVTGLATGSGCFCRLHVHRSVHVTKKRWPEGIEGQIKDFMQLDVDLATWARDYIDELVKQREATGVPVMVERRLSPAQIEAIRHELAKRPGIGTVQ